LTGFFFFNTTAHTHPDTRRPLIKPRLDETSATVSKLNNTA